MTVIDLRGDGWERWLHLRGRARAALEAGAGSAADRGAVAAWLAGTGRMDLREVEERVRRFEEAAGSR